MIIFKTTLIDVSEDDKLILFNISIVIVFYKMTDIDLWIFYIKTSLTFDIFDI